MPFDNPYFPQQFDVGTPGAGHIHFAPNGSLTLYDTDGITVDASLDPVNGLRVFKGTITGALVQTSAAGSGLPRIALDGPNNKIVFNSGTAGEIDGRISLDHVAAAGSIAPRITFAVPISPGGTSTYFELTSAAGTIPRQVTFHTTDFTITDDAGNSLSWDGTSLNGPAFSVGNSSGIGHNMTWDGNILTANVVDAPLYAIVGGPASWGGLFLRNRGSNPSAPGGGNGVLFVAGGDLRYIGSSGTVTVLAPA